MVFLKILKYITREFKNLFEFYLFPFLALMLPHKIYYPFFKYICKNTFFYNTYSDGSYKSAQNILEVNCNENTWERNVKLLYLTDITDYWLAKYRPKKLMSELIKKGNWFSKPGYIVLGMHWGAGYNVLVDLKLHSINPFFVFNEPLVSFKFQSFIEKQYRKARVKHIHKISGSIAITTGGGYSKIKNILDSQGVPIILYDAPQFDRDTDFSLIVFNKKYKVASGFINLICKESYKFQLYSSQINFDSGERLLTINPIGKIKSKKQLIILLSEYFEKLLISSPEQWYFWRQSCDLFELLESKNQP